MIHWWRDKSPEESVRFLLDWRERIARNDFAVSCGREAFHIVTSQWIVPAGLTEVASGVTNSTTWIVLSGGTAGETYDLTNTIVTDTGEYADLQNGFTLKETCRLCVRSK